MFGIRPLAIGSYSAFKILICEKQAYTVITFVWNYAMPVMIFAYCYARIFHTIRRQSKVLASHARRAPIATTSRDPNAGQVQQQATGATAADATLSRTELNILQTMIAVIACFIISWTPGAFNKIVMGFTVC